MSRKWSPAQWIQGKYYDWESPSQNRKRNMGWFAWPEYSSIGVWDKVFILIFIIYSRKQAEMGIPSFVFFFQCRISLQVFGFSYFSQLPILPILLSNPQITKKLRLKLLVLCSHPKHEEDVWSNCNLSMNVEELDVGLDDWGKLSVLIGMGLPFRMGCIWWDRQTGEWSRSPCRVSSEGREV